MNLPSLTDLFPDADYGFPMRLRPGDPAEFFAPSSHTGTILAERARWLQQNPARYTALDPAFVALVPPLIAFASAASPEAAPFANGPTAPLDLLHRLGRAWEPDFLVLAPDAGGRFVLRGGCVCFPSGWALEEKVGLPLDEIHGVVPGLNAAIGSKIHQFLARLKPGAGWYRSNWGLSSSAECNQHPSRAIMQLARDTKPETTWLRVEHQVLTGLPDSPAILFGIRLENVSLAKVKSNSTIRVGLRRALATMPEPMVAYKNLTAVRPALVEYLT
jgi:hypothetical protein